jgi:outer membrane protein assembly factor BamB
MAGVGGKIGRTRTALVLSALLAQIGTGAALGGDWPQFKRDAARTGDAPDEVLTFPMQRVVAVRFPAPIYASPAVVGGRVYVQDALGHVACIEAKTKRVVWLRKIGGINNSSSPAAAGGKVYVGSTLGDLAVLDAASGEVVARTPLGGPVIAAPAVTDAAVYAVTFNGGLFKLDRDGKVVWSFDAKADCRTELAVLDGAVFFATDRRMNVVADAGTCCAAKAAGIARCLTSGPLPLGGGAFAYQAFDAEAGSFAVSGRKGGPGFSGMGDTRAVPSRRGDLLFRGDRCWRLKDEATVESVWKADPHYLYDGGFHSSPALAKDVLVLGTELGRVLAFPLDGSGMNHKPVWEYRVERYGRPDSAISSSPAIADGRIFVGGEDGILYGFGQGTEAPIFAATPPAAGPAPPQPPPARRGGEWPTGGGDMGFSHVAEQTASRPPFALRWRTRIFGPHKHNPVVADGRMYLASRMGSLVALDAETGEILWRAHHPGVESRPAPTWHEGRLLVLRSRGGHPEAHDSPPHSGGPDGEGLWCHDARTGEVLWRQPMPHLNYYFNSDGPVAADGKTFVCQADEEKRLIAVAYACADGKEVWRTPLADARFEDGWESKARGAGKAALAPRFAGALSGDVWCLALRGRPGLTLGLDTHTGRILWQTDKAFIGLRSRIAARRGVLVVFRPDHRACALDAQTGRELWTSEGEVGGPGTYYQQALSDLFLDSRGREGLVEATGCALPVFANGLWYTHKGRWTGGWLTAKEARQGDYKTGKDTIVWSQQFGANACPSPAIAYERLYYVTNGEGVAYCFEPVHELK